MPKQAPLRIIKRWRRYQRRGEWTYLRPITRGVYVLYNEQNHSLSNKHKQRIVHVAYIGVAGVAKEAKTGINSDNTTNPRRRNGLTIRFSKCMIMLAERRSSNLRVFFWLSLCMIRVLNWRTNSEVRNACGS